MVRGEACYPLSCVVGKEVMSEDVREVSGVRVIEGARYVQC